MVLYRSILNDVLALSLYDFFIIHDGKCFHYIELLTWYHILKTIKCKENKDQEQNWSKIWSEDDTSSICNIREEEERVYNSEVTQTFNQQLRGQAKSRKG